ncbi:VanZ family protein [Paenibacillus sp.]|uniref:VanZ family protein n=1 Tax=Paenibacillus sp. TaxID=58172 RepID=UPI0035C7DC93
MRHASLFALYVTFVGGLARSGASVSIRHSLRGSRRRGVDLRPADEARGGVRVLLSALYASLDEAHQYFVPFRSATLTDLAKDVVASRSSGGRFEDRTDPNGPDSDMRLGNAPLYFQKCRLVVLTCSL